MFLGGLLDDETNTLRHVILLMAILGLSCARAPVLGDHVGIKIESGVVYWGNITNVSQSMICLNCTEYMAANGAIYTYDNSISENPFLPKGTRNSPYDVCIGTGTISSLSWPRY